MSLHAADQRHIVVIPCIVDPRRIVVPCRIVIPCCIVVPHRIVVSSIHAALSLRTLSITLPCCRVIDPRRIDRHRCIVVRRIPSHCRSVPASEKSRNHGVCVVVVVDDDAVGTEVRLSGESHKQFCQKLLIADRMLLIAEVSASNLLKHAFAHSALSKSVQQFA